jgi:phage tail sheath protein FI
MPFQLSPGVAVVERDLTSIVPAVSTSAGAFAGAFAWGPVEDPVQIASENELVSRFGKPNDNNFIPFYTAANFLSYANNLLVVRTTGTNLKNAGTSGTPVLIKNLDNYTSAYASGQGTVGEFAAKYPGSLGNSLKFVMVDSETFTAFASANADLAAQFEYAPGTSPFAVNAGKTAAEDEVHIMVIDVDGQWTGTAGSVLEKFTGLSKASDAKKPDGSNNYYAAVINSQSKYLWWMDHPTAIEATGGAWGASITTIINGGTSSEYKALSAALIVTLTGGADDYAPTSGNIQTAYSIFANDELYDISLVMAGKATTTDATYIINNVAEVRKDCVAFISPQDVSDGSIVIGSTSTEIGKLTAYRDALPSSSYAVLDSGYKYQYDRYNDKFRYIPLNGDIAGLCARTDYTTDPWFSPGGLNRGQIKNVVKLAVNAGKTQRDTLYKKGINPVVTFPGEGTVLFGDKTLLAAPSAFDRINVRRLFIVLEKAIATAAKFQLFEFNDGFTRAQFRNLIEPFLRDVQGRRGVTDFRVKCDDTNNTGEVIDRNEFVAEIFVKPNRSINFITLTFVASRSSVNFNEIGA